MNIKQLTHAHASAYVSCAECKCRVFRSTPKKRLIKNYTFCFEVLNYITINKKYDNFINADKCE